MPRIRKDLKDSIFYLFRRDPKTGNVVGPEGTGFLISPDADPQRCYAVANWHVAIRGASIIRLNSNGGGRFLEYDPSEWHFRPGRDDIALIEITQELQETDEIFKLSEEMFVTQEIVEEFEVGLGEDLFMIGMFAESHGGDRNVPAARFGNLSMLAHPSALIQLENEARRPAYLGDMRSRGGFSGSPVFVYRTDTTDISSPYMQLRRQSHPHVRDAYLSDGRSVTHKEWFVGLLGIHCGQFWESVEFRKQKAEMERRGDPVLEGDNLVVQGGMTIIAPAWEIIDLLHLANSQSSFERLSPPPAA
ncbi:hypothetical protein XI07_15450 [Bradyrhizobium sp. CCBAU 11445]|uniref:hypothetical protein n=1 Tax=Bradyrhizobium sp. CCBAU 11445 TaxID=1630896 RepID=UPI0023051F7A|nr:hypothetical protein [Bradyrhizobium sp. CCBAU 11445]MDA9483386.1 hypothetical protein [Bradyrhizobium sp. CCBAU 11445]